MDENKSTSEFRLRDILPDYSKLNKEVYYFDDEGNRVRKEEATKVMIRYLDSNNRLVSENWGRIEKGKTR